MLKKLSEHQIYQSEQKNSQKKLFLVTEKCKGAKHSDVRMIATQRNLQAQPKMLKIIVETSNQPIRTKIFSKKLCFVP
jgi:hypothetical protein